MRCGRSDGVEAGPLPPPPAPMREADAEHRSVSRCVPRRAQLPLFMSLARGGRSRTSRSPVRVTVRSPGPSPPLCSAARDVLAVAWRATVVQDTAREAQGRPRVFPRNHTRRSLVRTPSSGRHCQRRAYIKKPLVCANARLSLIHHRPS